MKERKNIPALIAILVVPAILVILLQWRGGSEDGDETLGQSFEFDIKNYSMIDPALYVFMELAPVKLDDNEWHGIAVGPDDDIFVCGKGRVAVFDNSGKKMKTFAVKSSPRCIGVGESGIVYLGADDHVEVYDAEGVQTAVWESAGEKAFIASLAVSPDTVFAANAADGSVLQFDKSGKLLKTIDGFVLFSSPNLDIALGPSGDLWAANPGRREMRRYSSAGRLVDSWRNAGRTIEGFSGCCNPMHIAVRSDGTIITSEKNIVRIKILDSDGGVVGAVAGPEDLSGNGESLDLCVDSKNRILVLDTAMKAVRVFAEKNGDEHE